jgi:predicted site-specific integrase-resolvase
MIPQPITTWLKKGELAPLLGVSIKTVDEWRRAGLIPAIRVSRKVLRFNLDHVIEALSRTTKECGRGSSDQPKEAVEQAASQVVGR